MAERGQKPRCYVYRIFDGFETLYVGKGSGRRLNDQASRFRAQGEILEECEGDDEAFARERHWIALLHPTANKLAGGNGGRCRPRRVRLDPMFALIDRIGSRKLVAQELLKRINETNCALFGRSAADVAGWRAVATGPRC